MLLSFFLSVSLKVPSTWKIRLENVLKQVSVIKKILDSIGKNTKRSYFILKKNSVSKSRCLGKMSAPMVGVMAAYTKCATTRNLWPRAWRANLARQIAVAGVRHLRRPRLHRQIGAVVA